MAVQVDEGPPTDDLLVTEVLEAEIRQVMARLPKSRGWDTQRARQDALDWLDVLLDEYLELTAEADHVGSH